MHEMILEVIACSVADAIEAEKGGAGRLEVVRSLDRGGLTPPFELVRAIKDAVDLPLRVMVRESDGYETTGETEIEKLCAAADEFSRLDVDGLVLGFLKGKSIDLDLTARVLAAAPRLKSLNSDAIAIEMGRFAGTNTSTEATYSPNAITNASRVPATAPGHTSGRVTRTNLCHARAPSEPAASSRLGSTCSMLAWSARTTSGMNRKK